MQLEELMALDADIVLNFEDGTVSVNSTHLRMCSKVLGHALEAATAGSGPSAEAASSADAASSGTRKRPRDGIIPVSGVKKHEWMAAASFLYPIAPRPVITGWDQLAVVLHVGSSLDMLVLLDLAAGYLTRNVGELGPGDGLYGVWKWLALADKAGLNARCIGSLTRRAAHIDKTGCRQLEKLEGLSPCVLKQLVVACARSSWVSPTEGHQSYKPCHCETIDWDYGAHHFDNPAPHRSHTLRWVCDRCDIPKPAPVAKEIDY